MKNDTDAVGGFFEDLPVLVFVLAGVMSVAGTACWTGDLLSEDDSERLARDASRLVTTAVDALVGQGGLVSVEAVRSANLSGPLSSVIDAPRYIVSVWCVHPQLEPLLVVGESEGDPATACSESMYMNALCEDGVIGILEVRALVWLA